MKVARAKRRLLKWRRYLDKTGSVSNHKYNANYHRGHTIAYWNYMFAHRYPPVGPRIPVAWLSQSPGRA
jgi:hypothetical protein